MRLEKAFYEFIIRARQAAADRSKVIWQFIILSTGEWQ